MILRRKDYEFANGCDVFINLETTTMLAYSGWLGKLRHNLRGKKNSF